MSTAREADRGKALVPPEVSCASEAQSGWTSEQNGDNQRNANQCALAALLAAAVKPEIRDHPRNMKELRDHPQNMNMKKIKKW